MQREFGKRTAAQPRGQPTSEPAPARAKPAVVDPGHLPKAILGIVVTFVIVGGMFLLPMMGQCDGHRGAFGLDWCRLMKASLEGAVHGVAAGRGASAAS